MIDDRPDVVLLDLGLPDVDGVQVLTMMRSVSDVPVIVVTARDDDADIVKALDAGADDFVTKPFGPTTSRRGSGPCCGAAGSAAGRGADHRRRARGRPADAARPRSRARPLELSRKEFDLLLALAQRAGEVVSKRDLLAEVWRQPYGGGDRTVDVHLSWLRRKLGESAAEPRYLHSTRGVGRAPRRPRRRLRPPRVRRRLTFLVAAITTAACVAFLVPLGLLLRTLAEDRAVAAATSRSQTLLAVAGDAFVTQGPRRRAEGRRAG